MKIGIITSDKVPSLVKTEQPLIPLFNKKNIVAEALVWNDPTVDWEAYDYLIFRSVWDYHLHPAAFSEWLALIESNGIKTLNAIEVVRSNQHKFYLKRLEESGIKIAPTVFIDKTNDLDLSSVRDKGWHKAVIKPAVSASSFLTEAFDIDDIEEVETKYKSIALDRVLLVQKFMPEVNTFGELSIIFFNRRYSHTVLKTATENEFRVQSEYGGKTTLFEPDEATIATASHILSQFEGDILYARVDGLISNGEFVLMEIELIEPYLFFEYGEGSMERFVENAVEMMGDYHS